VITLRDMRWAGLVARMVEDCYKNVSSNSINYKLFRREKKNIRLFLCWLH